MKRSDERILTTHVGSMIRPPELVALGKTVKEFPDTQPHYDALLNKLVDNAFKKQVASGIDIPNDGEYGKSSWAAYMLERVSGYEMRPDQIRQLSGSARSASAFATSSPSISRAPLRACRHGPASARSNIPAKPRSTAYRCAQGRGQSHQGRGSVHDGGGSRQLRL